MKPIPNITQQNIDKYFKGIMINEKYPGWACRQCGWQIGSIGLPPHHDCNAHYIAMQTSETEDERRYL